MVSEKDTVKMNKRGETMCSNNDRSVNFHVL